MEALIPIVLFGLVWGSFLNVVIYRLPLDLNLARPPSACPKCGTRIKARHNIPVVSWLILRGRCRNCGQKIPVTYPIVEILTPASFLILHHRFGGGLPFLTGCLFASALIVLAFIDLEHQILPDEITLSGLALALVYAFFRRDMILREALIGSLVGAVFLLAVYAAYYLLRKKEGLGLGDVTMMLFVGAYLGWVKALFTLMLASFAGAIIGVLVVVLSKKDTQYALPYGTFLAPAAFVALVWGDRILSSYLGLFGLEYLF